MKIHVQQNFGSPCALVSPESVNRTSLPNSVSDSVAELRELRELESAVEFRRARVGRVIDRLHSSGESAALPTVLRDRGEVTATRSKHEATQSLALDLLSELNDEEKPLGGDYLEIIARQLSRLEDTHRQEISGQWVIAIARKLTADEFRRRLARKVEQVQRDIRRKETGQQYRASSLSHWMNNRTGEGHISANLSPLEYETIAKAIDAEARSLAGKEDTDGFNNGNLQAQALVSLIMAGSATNGNGSWGNFADRPKPQIEVQVDLKTFLEGRVNPEGICSTTLGSEVAIETLDRFVCDSLVRRVVFDNKGVPINVGRSSRTATKSQRAAARAIYGSCAWDDCETRFDWCEMHHIKEWQDGGDTNFDNLLPLCSQHHHLVHEGQWSIKLAPDRSLEHYKPDGSHYKTTDPPDRTVSTYEYLLLDGEPWPQPEDQCSASDWWRQLEAG